jgi:hypothetical protein
MLLLPQIFSRLNKDLMAQQQLCLHFTDTPNSYSKKTARI